MLLIARFDIAPGDTNRFRARARRALRLLTEQPGCAGGHLGRSPDQTNRWALVVRFDSVVAYRRALAPFPIREHVIPLLADAATDEPGGYEILAAAQHGAVSDYASLLVAEPGPDWPVSGSAEPPV